VIQEGRRAKEAATMALSDDLRKRVVHSVVEGGLSRNAAAKRFGVSIASAIRWVRRFHATGETSPMPTGGDHRSERIEAQRDYLLGLIGRQSDITLLEIRERLIANCGQRFSTSVLWRFFDRHQITFKKNGACRGAAALGRPEATPGVVRRPTRSRSYQTRVHRRDRDVHEDGAQERPTPARPAIARRHPARPL
jgi:transposase